jgi:hypothetical protein
LAVIVGLVALAVSERRLLTAVSFVGSAAAVAGMFEALAQFAGTSYIRSVFKLSDTVTMGLYSEGYVFVWRYLRDVEGLVGIVLFVLFVGFAGLSLWRREVSLPRAARVAMIAAIFGYLVHASMGVFFEKMVFYGRVLAMYIPFLVGGAILGLVHLRRPRLRQVGICVLITASAWSFMTFARGYNEVRYPAEFFLTTMAERGLGGVYSPHVLWDLSEAGQAGAGDQLGPEFTMVADSRPDGSDIYIQLASHEEARMSGARFIGVNLKWMFYIRERYDRFEPPPGYTLIAEAPHPNALPAVGYEGHKPWERKRLRERRYTMRIYERVADQRELTHLWPEQAGRPRSGS